MLSEHKVILQIQSVKYYTDQNKQKNLSNGGSAK